jgi:PAC2 family
VAVTLLRLRDDVPPLTAPVLLGAFDGWIDAGGAASAAAVLLADDGEIVATAEHDTLFDYRSRRPVLDVVDGTLTHLAWPELSIRRRHAGGRDLLILHGPEPDFRWRELGDLTAEIAVRLGVVQWVSVGAIPAAVPHTRPVPVFGTASADGLLQDDVAKGPDGLLRVPAAALSVLEMSVAGTGIPTVGFYAQVPHYVSGPYAPGAIALLEQLGRHLGVDLPLGDLPDDAVAQRSRLDAAVGDDEDARRYLERLESIAGDDEGIPSGDELASEIERFLRGEGPEQGGEPPRAT